MKTLNRFRAVIFMQRGRKTVSRWNHLPADRGHLQATTRNLEELMKEIKSKDRPEPIREEPTCEILFSDRLMLEKLYYQWLNGHPEIKDCPQTVVTFLLSNKCLDKYETKSFLHRYSKSKPLGENS